MPPCSELVRDLQDAHGIELRSLTLLEEALSGEPEPTLADLYREHITETKRHVSWIETLLAARGAQPSLAADMRGRVTGDFVSFAALLRMGGSARTLATVYAIEHLEIATYELIARAAERLNDGEVGTRCRQILNEEHSTAAALHACLDQLAVRAGQTPTGTYVDRVG